MFRWKHIASYDAIHAERQPASAAQNNGSPQPPPPAQDERTPSNDLPTTGRLRHHNVSPFHRGLLVHVPAAPTPIHTDPRTEPATNDDPARKQSTSPTNVTPATTKDPLRLADRPAAAPLTAISQRSPFSPPLDNTGVAMAKYLSKEWVQAGQAAAQRDHGLRALLDGADASILCVVHDTPDHADEVFYIHFGDGDLQELFSGTVDEFKALNRTPTFEVHGDYNTYTLIHEGHITQTTAITRGKLKLKGSWFKAMRYMKAMDELTKALRQVPTEF